jgi:glutamyl-tRNA(Gln) amidotransferase subunit E
MYDFIFKSFREMTPDDYQKVGFKSGLEIHQQLLTEKKLFCRCPAGHYSKDFDAEILRHMRPTLSEMGVYDGTALMEFKTKKDIIYRINRNTVCTYEMDDTPPFLMNEDALDIALGIGMLFNCNIVDELHIARKQYLDGSIPTGFQRTAICALDGWIPYKDKKIKIVQMSIEEDSCREVSDIGHERFYKTDRLGMPLIETVTEPAMKTPFEVAEVAWILTNTVRSTHKVRRGIGSAREDVNVSVTGGTRIEIKGVSKISYIPLLTYNEAMRQWNLLRLKEELKNRGITEESFKAESFDITKIVRKPTYAPLKNAVEKGYHIKSVVLKGFAGLLRWQTQTDTYFSKEISDRVRVIACLTSIPNIIHSDSKGDNIPSADWTAVRKFSNAADNDSVVIVWGSEEDSTTAVKEIIIRAKEATVGIPSETRQALSDGTNGFERILPGADRMYPDTDLPPMRIIQDRLDKIKSWIPEQFWLRQLWYKELGIPDDVISELCISRYALLFKQAVKEWNVNPTAAAVFLIQYPKRLKKKGINISILNEDIFGKVLKAFSNGEIPRDAVLSIMKNIIEKGYFTEDIVPEPANEKEISRAITDSIQNIQNTSLIDESNKKTLLMGAIMNKLKGKVSAATIAGRIGFRKKRISHAG